MLSNMLTISIVTYHTETDELVSCLASLDLSVVDKVYVIDNGSEERLREFCRNYPFIEYHGRPNLGYGTGHNFAIRESLKRGSDYHLVLNSDVRFDVSVLPQAIEYMDANPEVGLLHPAVYYPDGRIQHTVRLLPTPIDVFGRRFLPNRLFEKRNRYYTLADADRSRSMNVPNHQGSFMFLRTSVLREIGLFDERFFMYPEDMDLTRRIHERYRTMYWPGISVIHDHRAASYSDLHMLSIHIRNMIRYFNKWGWFFDRKRRFFNRSLLSSLGKSEN